MFRHIAGLRVPLPAALADLLDHGAASSPADVRRDHVRQRPDRRSAGNVKKNSPFAIALTLQIMSIFAVFIMTAFVSNVVVRDDETGFGPIVHSTRVSKFDYLFGRFTGAFAAGCAGIRQRPAGDAARLVHAVARSRDARAVPTWRLCSTPTSCSALPTLFVMAAFCFALATITRSMLGDLRRRSSRC